MGDAVLGRRFLTHVFRAQGLEAFQFLIQPISPDSLLAVKNWYFIEPPTYPEATHPYKLNNTAIPMAGIEGQRNPNPPNGFNEHIIVRLGGDLYDPSYGAAKTPGIHVPPFGIVPFINQYENNAFSGYGSYNESDEQVYRKNDTSSQTAVQGNDLPSDG